MILEDKFEQSLKKLQLKSLMNLKSAKERSSLTLKLGCSLIAIFFDKFDKQHDSNKSYEIDEGINSNLYNYYFSEPIKMYRLIQTSPEILKARSISDKNINFAIIVLKGIDQEISKLKGSIGDANKSIFQFLMSFIHVYLYYDPNISAAEKKNRKIT